MTLQAVGIDNVSSNTLYNVRVSANRFAGLMNRYFTSTTSFTCYYVHTDKQFPRYQLCQPDPRVMEIVRRFFREIGLSEQVLRTSPASLEGMIGQLQHSFNSDYPLVGPAYNYQMHLVNPSEISIAQSAIPHIQASLEKLDRKPSSDDVAQIAEKYNAELLISDFNSVFRSPSPIEFSQPYIGQLGPGVFDLYCDSPIFERLVTILKDLGMVVKGWNTIEPCDVTVGLKDKLPIRFEHLVFRSGIALRLFQDWLLDKKENHQVVTLAISYITLESMEAQESRLSPASHVDALLRLLPEVKGLISTHEGPLKNREYIFTDQSSAAEAEKIIRAKLESEREKWIGKFPDNKYLFNNKIQIERGSILSIGFNALQTLDYLTDHC